MRGIVCVCVNFSFNTDEHHYLKFEHEGFEVSSCLKSNSSSSFVAQTMSTADSQIISVT